VIASPDSVVLIPPEVNTVGLVRECTRLDELQREHPDHELFVIAFKTLPGNPFAIVMRIRKDVMHIQERWPLEVDPETRVVIVYAKNQVPVGDGRVE
jgi:hypothetical protein